MADQRTNDVIVAIAEAAGERAYDAGILDCHKHPAARQLLHNAIRDALFDAEERSLFVVPDPLPLSPSTHEGNSQ